jgi:two-component system CheB/CheR fusion protein
MAVGGNTGAARGREQEYKFGREDTDLRNSVATYGLTLFAVVAAMVARWLLDPVFGENLPFFTFYFAMLFAAWYGGLGPGLLSLALGIGCGMFFFAAPRYSLKVEGVANQFDILRFVGVGVAVSLICEALIRNQRRSELRRDYLRTTLASIGDAVITTDNDGRTTLMNQVAEKLTGWTNDEATGQPLDVIFNIVNEHSRKPVENPATRALREGVIVGLANHTLLIAKDGTERPIDDSASPIQDEHGVQFGCVLVFRDITDRKKMEDELRQVAAELSEANRRKDEFLATLAHELRNPLAPIRNGLQVMRSARDNGDTVEQARIIMERQVSQLVRLVDDLMDLSRINRGQIELRTERVHLAAILNSAVETSRPAIEEMGHELSVTIPDQPIVVQADPVRLAQVFLNLLNNAAKYSDHGGHVWLNVERQGSDVVVSVRDTGIGIPADQLGRIFEMFTQLDRSLEKSQSGLGIGLNIVKRLVEKHGGSIEARSDGPGRGAEFVVRLPVVVEAIVPQAADEKDEPDALKSSLRILIVDDNNDGANSLAMMLKIIGNETRTAYDGQEGVEAAEHFRPDVVLLDIGLPKLNGYEACRRIRQQPWGKNMVLIAVTGWGQDEDRRRSHEAGFDNHMVKPVEPKALMRLLTELNMMKP